MISRVVEHDNVPGIVSGPPRSSAPYVRSVRKDDICQRHGILKEQGTSTFAIANPKCRIRCDKVTSHLCMRDLVLDDLRFFSDSFLTS